MANAEHHIRLADGADAWNAWRQEQDISEVDLSNASLRGANLSNMNLSFADLFNCDLEHSNLSGADLSHAELLHTYLNDADLGGADFTGADFEGTVLIEANLTGSVMKGASLHRVTISRSELIRLDVSNASLYEVNFSDVDLSTVIGLDTCHHHGISFVDLHTIRRSGPLPIKFLRGIGLPDAMIDYLPALLNQPIQHYSCFISFSTKDQQFADRVHSDLQNHGVRCWFAPHDMPIGGKILDEIDSAIHLREKVVLVLSADSLKSDWVEDEVTKAFEEERKRGQTVLFPIRLDDSVMDTNEPWAAKLRRNRHIGDFTRWKEHDEYQKSFERVLRDLTVKKP